MRAKPSLTTVAETEAPHESNTNTTVSKNQHKKIEIKTDLSEWPTSNTKNQLLSFGKILGMNSAKLTAKKGTSFLFH